MWCEGSCSSVCTRRLSWPSSRPVGGAPMTRRPFPLVAFQRQHFRALHFSASRFSAARCYTASRLHSENTAKIVLFLIVTLAYNGHRRRKNELLHLCIVYHSLKYQSQIVTDEKANSLSIAQVVTDTSNVFNGGDVADVVSLLQRA